MIYFSASNGSSTITVTDPNHGSQTGDFVTYAYAESLGGNITAEVLNQDYEITRVDSSTYTIQTRSTDKSQIVPVLANSSDVGFGGLLTNAYYGISSGYASTTYGYGWGAVFGERQPWVNAPKARIGHLSMACGAVESAIAVLALKEDFLPTTVADGWEGDEDCVVRMVPAPGVKGVRSVLKPSFGFGGQNACILVSINI